MTIFQPEPGQPIEVIDVIAGTPAERAGVKKGDKIIRVNGEDVRTLTTEEENRDAVLVELSRELPHGLGLAARYGAYFSATTDATPAYQRHDVALTITYQS